MGNENSSDSSNDCSSNSHCGKSSKCSGNPFGGMNSSEKCNNRNDNSCDNNQNCNGKRCRNDDGTSSYPTEQPTRKSNNYVQVQNGTNKPYRATALLRKTRLLFFYEKPLISS